VTNFKDEHIQINSCLQQIAIAVETGHLPCLAARRAEKCHEFFGQLSTLPVSFSQNAENDACPLCHVQAHASQRHHVFLD
jgi:hypothetical protein